MTDEESTPEEKPKRGLGERIREHIQAAEVAAEEAAGYGFVAETVEAVEAAVNPEHELGPQKHQHGNGDSATSQEPDEAASGDLPEAQPQR